MGMCSILVASVSATKDTLLRHRFAICQNVCVSSLIRLSCSEEGDLPPVSVHAIIRHHLVLQEAASPSS